LNAAKEKLEIVSGVAPPPFRIFVGGFFRKNAFGLIQVYCTLNELKGFEEAKMRDALRASRILASSKPLSSILVRLLYQVRTYFQNKVR